MTPLPPKDASTKRGRVFGVSRRMMGFEAGIVLALMLVIHACFFQTFTVPSGSMEPTYIPGDRIIVRTYDVHPRRGDVVVFDGAGSLYEPAPRNGILRAIDGVAGLVGFHPGQRDYLKRIIGVGGDTLRVDAHGALFVNGVHTPEKYLPQPDHASAQAFSVKIPAGEFFVMGDNRAASDDSRNHLGDPGGGFVARDKIVGLVAATYWHG